MIVPLALAALTSLAAATPPPADSAGGVSYFWQTRAERTGYRLTADYDETMRFCRTLAAGSEWVKLESYGTSGQGRELPLLIVSKDRAFTPEAARATGKPILLIQNGIHAGEIEGKDASLALVRDLTALARRTELLDHAILLVLPIFSVDAHERSGPYNRMNQNGPERMGWRRTPIGLNLNRDYLKADSPEMRAMLSRVFTRWWPHLLVDCHTTDGADYRHDLTYGINKGAGVPASIDRWMADAFEGRVLARVRDLGHLPCPYVSARKGNDLRTGIDFGNVPPRFSTGYSILQGRPGILIETHMLKPYASRVRATYDLLLALLEEVNARPEALTGAVAAAEAEAIARGRERDPAKRELVLSTRTTDTSVPFEFKGVSFRWMPSDLAGAPVPRYGAAAWDTILPLYRETVPTLTVREPVGYLVPQEWTVCRDRLDLHGVRYRRFARTWSDSVEVARIVEWSASARPDEGHFPLSVSRIALERRMKTWRPGDLWVPLDQRSAAIAVHLFEAQAPDGLTRWNAFDTVLETKEYGEDYVMDPIAHQMVRDDAALAAEFRARVAADTGFAHSPAARLDWFYRRSKWADPEQNLVPVARALRAPPETVLESLK